jgi:signal transduction histidine kinase/DNA-binding response OmpR family regulator
LSMATTDIDQSTELLHQELETLRDRVAALEAEADRFRAFAKATSDVFYCMSPDWTEMRHLQGREFIADTHEPSRTWLDKYIHPDDQPLVRETISRAIRTKGVFELEHRVIRRDGTLGWTYSRAIPILNAQGEIVEWFGAASDVTERKRAEQQLFEVNQRLQSLMDAVPVGVSFSDDPSCQNITGNPTVLAQFEVARQDNLSASALDPTASGRQLRFFRGGQPLTDADLPMQRAVAENAVIPPMEIEVHLPSGRRWIAEASGAPVRDAHGDVIGGIAVTVDITERQQAEAALRELNEMLEQRVAERTELLRQKESQASALAAELQTVMETVPAIAFVAHDPQCRQMTYNRMAREVLRLPEGANPSKSAPESERITNFRIKRDGVELATKELPMRIAAATGREIHDAELSFEFDDGTHRDILGNASPLLDESGRIRGAVGAFIDITDRKRAESEKLEMERRLRHAQKLESIGVLASGLAHDFNNILVGIMGHAEMLKRSLPAADRAQVDLDVIKQSVQRAADLTRQMLAYSGKGKIIVEPVHISRVVEDAEQMLEVAVSKKAGVTYDLATMLPLINADASQICQVVMNLVINASEALGEQGGVIAVSTGVIDCDAKELAVMFQGHHQREGRYVYLQVADTGCGMDQETLAKIFDPFFTTKFTGRGLGLAAVYGIVQNHEGAIQVSSETGTGATFRVLFPAGGPALPIPRTAVTEQPATWHGSGKVLVVDDEEIARTVAQRLIDQIGFTVVTAKDGDEAIRIFHEQRDEIVCVVLDLTMPKMSGEQTFRELRKIDPGVSVVLSSGYSEEGATERFSGLGLAGFIQKPYQFDGLVAVLQAAVALAPGNTQITKQPSKATLPPKRSQVPSALVSGVQGRDARTVLVVDDDTASRQAMEFFFREADFSTLAAQDGEEAIQVFREHQNEIVCVFLDVNLPTKDGIETFHELRKIDPKVRIVVTSGDSPANLRQRFAGLNVLGFVDKPESPDAVIDKLWESIRSDLSVKR